MEIREIAGELFLLTKINRRDELATPSAAKTAAQAAISEAEAELRDLGRQSDELRVQIEEAVLFDEPTQDLRQQLAAVSAAIETSRAVVGTQRRRIADINAAVDAFHATRLKHEHAAHIAAITAPFEKVLQEIHQ